MAEQTIKNAYFIATLTNAGDAYFIRPLWKDNILAEVKNGDVQLMNCLFFPVKTIADFSSLVIECSVQFMVATNS